MILSYIIKLHEENGLTIDNEVPYETKLLITYAELEDAIHLRGFNIQGGKFVVPKVVKEKHFLESYEVKLRLALNALTSPHMVMGNDKEQYEAYKHTAERNIIIFAIEQRGKRVFSQDDPLRSLFQGKHGEKGELYLGYKNYPSVRSWLEKVIHKVSNGLQDEKLIAITDDGIRVSNDAFISDLKILHSKN